MKIIYRFYKKTKNYFKNKINLKIRKTILILIKLN